MARIFLFSLRQFGTALLLLCCLLRNAGAADVVVDTAADEKAVRAAVADYVDAFNKHDGKKLAELWSPDAVYQNRVTGEQVVGRDAIAEQFTAMFKDSPDARMTAESESVQFVSPNVAVERGASTVTAPKEKPDVVPYSAVYVKRDGKWLLDRVTDEGKDEKPSHYDELKTLDWLVGKWSDKDDQIDVETEVYWSKNKNFLIRAFSVSVDGRPDISGMQVIGWDAGMKKIRSWTFDSDGGVAQGIWTERKDRWYIVNEGTLGNGEKASMTNVIKKIDDNSFTWQTIERTVAGEILPNVPETLIVRQ